jgi:hypothetical protein
MRANEIFDAYFSQLVYAGRVAEYVRGPLWTHTVTTALTYVGLLAFPEGSKVPKSRGDTYGRSDYIALDVMITDPNTWGPPLFVAEHEDAELPWKVEYCAWKLLAVDAQLRVLVAYFGKGTEFETFDDLRKTVEAVTNDNAGKGIIVIGGNYMATPSTLDELRKVHKSAIVGTTLL